MTSRVSRKSRAETLLTASQVPDDADPVRPKRDPWTVRGNAADTIIGYWKRGESLPPNMFSSSEVRLAKKKYDGEA
jgi:hypothetical protein